MILMRSNISPNFNPVAIGAPQLGETCVQITQTPKHAREPRDKSSENVEKPLLRGAMVTCYPVAGGVRWPKSNWEIPADTPGYPVLRSRS